MVTKGEANLTRNEKFIRKHQNSMRNVRNAMVELELAKSFLTEPDDPDVLRLAQFEGLEDLYGTWTDGRVTRRIPLLTAVCEQLENLTFVISGAN